MAQHLDLALTRQMQTHHERGPGPHYKPHSFNKNRALVSNRRLSLVGTAQNNTGHIQRPHQKHHQHAQDWDDDAMRKGLT
eukprot:scaffold138941_cov19-Tisochrysis_lutea.AAC.1